MASKQPLLKLSQLLLVQWAKMVLLTMELLPQCILTLLCQAGNGCDVTVYSGRNNQ